MSTNEHIHYWVCEPPNGVFSKAVCKYCKEETKFRNSPVHTTAWSRRTNIQKGHGLSKDQLEKELERKGEKIPNFPRELENKECHEANTS